MVEPTTINTTTTLNTEVSYQTTAWYTKEYNYFRRWVRNNHSCDVKFDTYSTLMEKYLTRYRELGCSETAIAIIRTALLGYFRLTIGTDGKQTRWAGAH